MAGFLFVYHGGSMPGTPEEGAKVMAKWQAWIKGAGAALSDPGAGVGKSSTVNADGSVSDSGGANPAMGYSLVEAADLGAAQKLAKGCPHLEYGGSIEIAPVMQM